MSGWIKIHRSIRDHWLYPQNRQMTKYEAWLTILIEVNHSDMKEAKGFKLIECKRGESIKSLDTWAKLFNWNKSKVRRFFIMLQNDSMIVTKSVQKTTHLTVCNYEDYQGDRNDTETILKRKRNDIETKLTSNKNDKEESKNDKEDKEDKEKYLSSFELFWNKYDKKIDKKGSLAKWMKLSKDDINEIFRTIDSYLSANPEKQYRKDPIRYMIKKVWLDEIIEKEKSSGKKEKTILTLDKEINEKYGLADF